MSGFLPAKHGVPEHFSGKEEGRWREWQDAVADIEALRFDAAVERLQRLLLRRRSLNKHRYPRRRYDVQVREMVPAPSHWIHRDASTP